MNNKTIQAILRTGLVWGAWATGIWLIYIVFNGLPFLLSHLLFAYSAGYIAGALYKIYDLENSL